MPQRSVNLKRRVGRRRPHRTRRFWKKALHHDTLEKVSVMPISCISFLHIHSSTTILSLSLLTPRLAQDAPVVGAPRPQRVPPCNGIHPARVNTAKTYGEGPRRPSPTREALAYVHEHAYRVNTASVYVATQPMWCVQCTFSVLSRHHRDKNLDKNRVPLEFLAQPWAACGVQTSKLH